VTRYGSKYSGGYQMPDTDSARLRRGEVLRRERTAIGEVTLTKMIGAREQVFEIATAIEKPGAGGPVSERECIFAKSESEARIEYARACSRVRLP
jgi:hypothetical protein